MPQLNATSRRRLILLAKGLVAVVVVAFVWRSVADAARQLSTQAVRPDVAVLGLSGVVYLVSLLPMAWFWRRTLAALGQPSRWRDVLPAYYLGHLGKYVPGKALVVVLRTGAVRRTGGEAGPIAASVVVETLTLMAVGGAVASLLLVTLGGEGLSEWVLPLAVGMALVAAAPTLPPVMKRIVARLAPAGSVATATRGVTWPLVATGWAAALATWLGLAVSLWLALRSLDAQIAFSAGVALRCLLATSLPVVAGFLSLLPGGLLVRDGLMFALLKPLPALAEPTALAATLLVRLVWIVSELAACGMLVVGRRLAG